MLNRILLGIAIAATTFFSRDIRAQIAVSTAGGDAYSPSGSFSFTVGQTAYTYFQNENFELGLGVQQAYLVEPLSIVSEGTQAAIEIFPNPTSDELVVRLTKKESTADIRVFTSSGQLLFMDRRIDNTTTIPFYTYSPGVYLVHVQINGQPLRVFKIVKS